MTQSLQNKIEEATEKLDAQGLAILFHNTYEGLAPSFGYETREDTKVFDPESKNGKLMIAVCQDIINTYINPIATLAQKEARKEMIERTECLELAREELLELRGCLCNQYGKFELDEEKLEKYWNSGKPEWEKKLSTLSNNTLQ